MDARHLTALKATEPSCEASFASRRLGVLKSTFLMWKESLLFLNFPLKVLNVHFSQHFTNWFQATLSRTYPLGMRRFWISSPTTQCSRLPTFGPLLASSSSCCLLIRGTFMVTSGACGANQWGTSSKIVSLAVWGIHMPGNAVMTARKSSCIL